MRFLKIKIFLALLFLIFIGFFSNNFGLIDIEETAIITAIAIDIKGEEEYCVTAQIAVPEATDTNSENQKAIITGYGSTIGAAIKNIGNISGWFPKLSFCNLIIIGESLKDTNVIRALDYFAKTLRVQDSALVVMAEKEAKHLLEVASPLDNISSFALQKILLKDPGFDNDIAPVDIRTFCIGYYSESGSSYMPYVKLNKEDTKVNPDNSSGGSSNGSSSGSQTETGGSSGASQTTQSNKGNAIFDARQTALFYQGKFVGLLDAEDTLLFNIISNYRSTETSLTINNVESEIGGANYLLTIKRSTPKITLSATENQLNLDISLDIFCKVVDQNTKISNTNQHSNKPLPSIVAEKTKQTLTEGISKLVDKEKQTGCDFLGLKKRLFRFNFVEYSRYKDNYLDILNTNINVNVSGQK